MQIAIVKDGAVISVGHYKELFPNTCFPISGPNEEFMTEHGAKKVNLFTPHNQETQHLVPCDPYEDGDWVYTMKVVDK